MELKLCKNKALSLEKNSHEDNFILHHINSIQKYTTLASCWHNIFADSGLKAAIINGQYTTDIILNIFYLKIFCKARIYVFTVFIVVIYTIKTKNAGRSEML